MFISYESVNLRFEQSLVWNAINPYVNVTVDTDEYQVYVMSDSHVGGTKNLTVFLEEARSADAAALIMVGDLTTGRESDYDKFEIKLTEADGMNVFPIVGNHDLYFNGWEQYYPRFGSTSYFFNVETPVAEDLFICLDSGSGTLGSSQLSWLTDILKNKRKNFRRCVVLTHVNFFRLRRTTSTNPQTEELYVLMDLFAKNNVDMVITGHDHKKSEIVFGETTYLVTDALEDDNANAGYLVLNFNSGNIEYVFEVINTH